MRRPIPAISFFLFFLFCNCEHTKVAFAIRPHFASQKSKILNVLKPQNLQNQFPVPVMTQHASVPSNNVEFKNQNKQNLTNYLNGSLVIEDINVIKSKDILNSKSQEQDSVNYSNLLKIAKKKEEMPKIIKANKTFALPIVPLNLPIDAKPTEWKTLISSENTNLTSNRESANSSSQSPLGVSVSIVKSRRGQSVEKRRFISDSFNNIKKTDKGKDIYDESERKQNNRKRNLGRISKENVAFQNEYLPLDESLSEYNSIFELGDEMDGGGGKVIEPIYEEIIESLHVDTSIDDLEGNFLTFKPTEKSDLYLPASNSTHINFLEPGLIMHEYNSKFNDTANATDKFSIEGNVFNVDFEEEELNYASHEGKDFDPNVRLLYSKNPNLYDLILLNEKSNSETRKFSSNFRDISTYGDRSIIAKDNNTGSENINPEPTLRNVDLKSLEVDNHNMLVLHEKAKLMMDLMDPNVDPCEDFYSYSCGRWSEIFPLRDDKAVDNTFERLKEDVDEVLHALLEESITNEDSHSTVISKVLYSGCMNIEKIEEKNVQPLLNTLRSIGGWPVLETNWTEANYSWVMQMAQLRLLNNAILISEWVSPDIANSSNHIVQIDQTELGLPGREYFLNYGDMRYRSAYLELMLKACEILGADKKVALMDMLATLAFEKQLSKILTPTEERRNLTAIHLRFTREQLNAEVPEIDWEVYLQTVAGEHYNYTNEVVVFCLDFLKKLVKLVDETDKRIVSNYLIWRFVKNRLGNLGEEGLKATQDFVQVIYGRKVQPERWRLCVAYVNANLDFAVGAQFVRRYYPEGSKTDTDEMINMIQTAFNDVITQADWMSKYTRRVALEKVQAIIRNVGYPDDIFNETFIDGIYIGLNFSADDHFENVLKVLQFHAVENHNLLCRPVERNAWMTSPAVVNAYYSRSKNMITFPAGILQPPFYHSAFPRSLNYGGIGVVIGHEITHGFDDQGRQFDKDGNLNQWWTEQDESFFYEKASCMLDQYGEYEVEELQVRVNPMNTLGENIADNSGLKIAYKAYQKWSKTFTEAVSLPFLNLTHNQLFFLNFGQIWCEINSPEAMLTRLRGGQHAPNKFRVIGTLSNTKEFSEAYSCPPGSAMNPIEKCSVW